MPARSAPLVTAITIFLDEEWFLADAIESVLAQSFTDWELILVDDGSSDRSPDIARAYAERHPGRMRYLAHAGRANLGMSASRNLGLGAARGDHVGFLDGDDVWLPEKLADQCAVLQAHPKCGLVYGRTLIWRSWDGGGTDFLYPLGVPADAVHAPPTLFELLLENKAQSPTTCNALMRRSLLESVGGFEDGFRGMFEDQAFFAKVLLRARVHVSDQCWAKYRQHAASHSALSARQGEDLAPQVAYLSWFLFYLIRHDPKPRAVAMVARKLAGQSRWLLRRRLRRGVKRVLGRA